MTELNKLVRENVLRLIPYSSARDEFKGGKGIFLDANENPYGKLNRYPDPYQKNLKSAISEFKEIGVEKIFLGNGSDEIIDLCFRVFCNPGTDKVLIFTPTYGMYEVSAYINDIQVIRVPLNKEFQIDIKNTMPLLSDKKLKLIFVCSPNNPTSNSMISSDVERIISSFGGIVIVDEAYIDFSKKDSFIKLIDKHPNLIVMQTFSKAFGLAAARIGMAFSNSGILQYFNKLKPPYNISTINQNAALHRLEKSDDLRKKIIIIREERQKLKTALSKMALIEKVYPSDSNFLLVKVRDAGFVYNELVKMNIITRNRSSMINNCLRITVGTSSENKKLIKALETILL
jgi:histidinol-phosphate aminotransferase